MTRNIERPMPVVDQLLVEARVMLRHALATGKRVPPSVIETLAAADPVRTESRAPGQAPESRAGDQNDGQNDSQAGGQNDSSSGSPPDPRALAAAHARLAALIAPATPRGLILVGDGSSHWQRFGNVPLVRRLLFLALVALSAFIGLSLLPYVGDPRDGDIFMATGLPLLINELFFLSAAAIGAVFAILFQVMRYVIQADFDLRYESVYWLQFILGLIAGLILATLIHQDNAAEISANAPAVRLTSAVLALLGGFSANLLYRLLTRLTQSVELLVTGGAGASPEERAQAADTRATQQIARERVQMAGALTELRGALAESDAPARLDALINRLLDPNAEDEQPAPAKLDNGAETAAAPPKLTDGGGNAKTETAAST